MEPMPEVKERRLLQDDEPDGYRESDRDFAMNNRDAVVWFLENHAAIRAALHL
jgi:hypothetical protein